MQKPVINYKGYMTDNPSDRTKPKICIPQIVDRNQVQTLEQVVAHAIDRGLIAGLKSSAAKSIADGIMLQLGETLNGGTGVIFGEFFAVRPYLTGTIANLLAPITTANKLRVRFVPGSAYKLDEKNFSFHNVTQSENLPKITSVQPAVSGADEFTFDLGEDLAIMGDNLKVGEDDAVKLYNCDGEEAVFLGDVDAAKITVNSNGLLQIDKTGIAALASVTKAGFVVAKTIEVEGNTIVVESTMVEATNVATPPVAAPDISSAKTRGESEGSVNVSGGVLEVSGTNLETATAVELWSSDALWQTVPVTYTEGKLVSGELDFENQPASGSVKVTTAGGTDTYAVTYCAH